MSHAVETMAYTNQVPWHGLGHFVADAPSVKAMIKLAKLNWQVEKRQLFLEGGVPVDGFSALVRDKDNAQLDVVGRAYVPTQNEEAFEFFKEFVEAGDATMETAGSLRGGRYVWGLAKLKSSFKLGTSDKVNGYLLVACPHQQGKAVVIKTCAERVVCHNTYTMAMNEENNMTFRMAHRRAFDKATMIKAKETIGVAKEQMGMFEEQARKLKAMKMGEQDHIDVLAQVYQDDDKLTVGNFDEKANRVMKQLRDILHNAPGADPATGWGCLNAVTYYADHIASRTDDKRLTNAWFGKTANHKVKVLNLLLA